MISKTMLVGGPHNGALISHSRIGAEAPTDIYVASPAAERNPVEGNKVECHIYRLIEKVRLGPLFQLSYEYVRPTERAQSLVDVWL